MVFDRFGLGDIAIDDIAVYPSCSNEDRLCSFEDPNICSYTVENNTQYNWIRTTGDDPFASGFKPSIDHTDGTSNGAYMMVDISRSSSVNNQRARLSSPLITPNGEQCVEYWYYTDAEILSTSSKLNLYVRSLKPTGTSSDSLISSRNVLRVSFNKIFKIFRDHSILTKHSPRIEDGELLRNVFHMDSLWLLIKWFSRPWSINQVKIHQSLR